MSEEPPKKKLPPKRPPKKRPTKKRTPVRRKGPKKIQATVEVELPGLDDRRAMIRVAALNYYMCNFDTTISKMARHPHFKGVVTRQTLQTWSDEDQWVNKRRQFAENVQQELEKKLASELVTARADQLTKMKEIYDSAVGKLQYSDLEVKSYEGLMNATAKWGESMDDFRDKLAQDMIPNMINGINPDREDDPMHKSKVAVRPLLTQDEARAAAKMLIAKRREQLRADMAAKKEADTSALTVVEGKT